MKIISAFSLFFVLGASMPGHAQRDGLLLDSDPDVLYLQDHVEDPLELRIIKPAPIYSDKEGKRRLGTVTKDQKVYLEAMTDKAYRVTAKTGGNQVKGWVAPWAFASKDPDFVENLKKYYERQLEVRKLIEKGRAALGMNLDEVTQALGNPSKTKQRQTKKGLSGSWEYVDYEEVKHYNYIRDPHSGQVYRQHSHTTREEKGKTVVEFEDDVVTAIEESENLARPGRMKIVVPPIVFDW